MRFPLIFIFVSENKNTVLLEGRSVKEKWPMK